MFSGGPLPDPRQQLHNTIANLSHITAVLPTAAPGAQIFGSDLIQALQLFRTVDENWDGITAAAGRNDGDAEGDDMSRWFRIQPSYRTGKHELARIFVQIQRIIKQMVTMANEDPYSSMTSLHLEFQVMMGLFMAVFEGMRAMERDFEPRDFEVVDHAIGFVHDMDYAKIEETFAEPAEGRDLQSLIESTDHDAGDLANARPSLIEVQRGALWRWWKQIGKTGPSQLPVWDRSQPREWKPIILPPEIKVTPPQPMIFQPAPGEGNKPKGRGLTQQERLNYAAAWALFCPFIIWIGAGFSTIRSFGNQYFKVDFAM
jgi:hypothetical protein